MKNQGGFCAALVTVLLFFGNYTILLAPNQTLV